MPIATWVDGVLGAGVSPLDAGFLYGESVFETMRATRGRVIELAAHLALLADAARAIGVPLAPEVHVRAALAETIAAAGEPDLRVRVIATGSRALAITAEPCAPLGLHPPVTLAIVDRPLSDPRTLDPSLKTGAYLPNRLALRDAQARGADEAVRLTAAGVVATGATSNLFAVIDGVLITPPASLAIRRGTTRARVAALADVTERACSPAELAGASELFITSSIRGVAPARLADTAIAAPGPVTRALAAAYLAFATSDAG